MLEIKKIAYTVLAIFVVSIFLGCVSAPPKTELKADGKSVYDFITKENYGTDKKLAAITVMYKEKGYDPAHNDWFWAKYEPNGTIDAEGKIKGFKD